jgi:hypothetical protein
VNISQYNIKAFVFRCVRKIPKKKKKPLASSCLSARPHCHWTDFHEIWYLSIFRKSFHKIKVSLKSDKNDRYFTWRPTYFLNISRSILLRVTNVSDESCRENQNTHFMFNNFFFFENRAVYEIMWKNNVQPDRPQMTIWRMCILC